VGESDKPQENGKKKILGGGGSRAIPEKSGNAGKTTMRGKENMGFYGGFTGGKSGFSAQRDSGP